MGPLHGQFVVRRLGLAMTNPHTKLEVSMFIHYKDMIQGYAKCRTCGDLGLGFTQGHQQCLHLIERIQLPIRL